MAWWYSLLLTIHILSAITAVGSNLTYGVWAARGTIDSQHLAFALRGIKFIDDRIANPAYILLLPTGAAMVAAGHLGFGTRWISWAMGLWLVAILVAYLGYTPALKRQLDAIVQHGLDSDAFRATQRRANAFVAVLGVVVLLILVLMVYKPV